MGIQFNQVSYFYRGVKNETYEAINQISLAINDGEFVAICGQTGSGKTTLVQHMNALLKPTRGTVQIYEHTLPLADKNTKIGPIRKKVGLVFQFPEYQLFEETILKDIMFGPLNFGLSLKDAEEKARHAAALVGLDEEILQKSPFRISGGQMRRVAIAGILAMEPEMLVLDEPTRGLDPKGSDEMMALFNELHEKHGKTIVLITHDMDIVARYAKRILVMDKGKIKFDGTRELLFMTDEFEKLHLAKPQAYRMMEYLSKTLGYPFKQIFTEEDLIQYLKEVHHE
ncbi:energy-coupling factor transporter ATPase [Paracholeplasma manati]|uniref:Energy-coupling factor transporter ATP-binding protein EcfA2 n=1 Tax=Paracholeplasma manati TaxID=591373 RepID=A0ABT2Y4I3_9MOLU|nr:energy-coupling factor transporter ATPase [Paracholeplasma manati]MCV2231641.1 energy-coupling factor transporter ATPase [Paracholeplasma manati]MDG0888616.1 energy-coupling factor transporter ATPase [Paracholeplasma manati]